MKRVVDVVAAGLGLLLAAPLLLVLAILVRTRLGSPVLYRQIRHGIRGRPFVLYKFRTMTEARDPAGRLLPDAERIPPFGKFLRAASLDELPELFNVLRGEMSLVGPRPLLPEYLDRYSPRQRRRLEVLPGITGWAQVNGRNALTWEERFAMDVWYVENASLGLDLRILGRTLFQVLRGRGITPPGRATMEEFRG